MLSTRSSCLWLPLHRNTFTPNPPLLVAIQIRDGVGFRAGFLFLPGVAAAALALFCFFMPETRDARAIRE